MSKRTLDSEIGETSTQIFTNLSPDERIQLMIDAMAEERESHVEGLIESTPVKTYEVSDLEVRDRHQTALLMALGASKELEVGMWHFHYARFEGLYHTQLAHEFEVDDWDFIEEPSPENDFLEGEGDGCCRSVST